MKKKERAIKKTSILAGALLGGASLTLGLQEFLSVIVPPESRAEYFDGVIQKNHAQEAFKDMVLNARAAYVFDLLTNKPLFTLNEDERLPLASITKVMTALVAREHIAPNVVITLSKEDLEAEGDTGLRPGERWRLADLLDVMLLVSSNDAAHAIAGFVGSDGQGGDHNAAYKNFVEMMNKKVRELGFATMQFSNDSGLDVLNTKDGGPAYAGGYGSAHEVALLLTELWKKYPEVVEITTHKDARITSQDGIIHTFPNTDEATGHFPGLIASKTGYTSLAGGNLAIIFDVGVGHPVVAVVLGSTYKGRFEDMQKLTQATLRSTQ